MKVFVRKTSSEFFRRSEMPKMRISRLMLICILICQSQSYSIKGARGHPRAEPKPNYFPKDGDDCYNRTRLANMHFVNPSNAGKMGVLFELCKRETMKAGTFYTLAIPADADPEEYLSARGGFNPFLPRYGNGSYLEIGLAVFINVTLTACALIIIACALGECSCTRRRRGRADVEEAADKYGNEAPDTGGGDDPARPRH